MWVPSLFESFVWWLYNNKRVYNNTETVQALNLLTMYAQHMWEMGNPCSSEISWSLEKHCWKKVDLFNEPSTFLKENFVVKKYTPII